MHSSIILGYEASKEGKLLDPKKNSAIVHMPTLKTPKDIQVFMVWHNTTSVSSKILLSLWLPLPNYYKDSSF
jgi:hypothetical protein